MADSEAPDNVHKLDPAFYDDPDTFLGLSHSSDGTEPSGASFNVIENPLLVDIEWNDRANERLAREAEERGEKLPPRVSEKTSGLEDRDFDAQCEAELAHIEKQRPDLNWPQQVRLAYERVSARQRQVHRNQGAYDDVRQELSRVRKERPELPLLECLRIARERADEARTAVVVQKDRPEEPGGLGASVISLMNPPRSGGKKRGGGRSGRRHAAKKVGTWLCSECHVEYCPHRPTKSRSGPKSKEGHSRIKQRSVRYSDQTGEIVFQDIGLSLADFLAVAAQAYRERRPLDKVLEQWKVEHGCYG